jgi:RNA 3'-terminal phosphate cyclase
VQTQVDAKTAKLITTIRQTASYTLVLGDADKLVEMNVGTANNLTVPASVFSAGTQILLAQYGAGQTTIVAGSGMTIRSNGGKLKLNVQYSGATLIFLSGTEAYLFGDIVA